MPTPDFSKIWASSSPLPEYTFSDADYLEGWEFVGSAPPTKNEFDAWFRQVDTKLKWLYDQLNNTASKLYPVGSVYISFNSADPSTLFGGTWVRLKDTFLLANGDTYAPNTTGGSPTKTIAVSNMPSHNHSVSSSGSHTHSANTSTDVGHSHGGGSLNVTGTFGTGSNTPSLYRNDTSGVFTNVGTNGNRYATGETNYDRTSQIKLETANKWSGATASAGSHSHTVDLSGGTHTHTTNNTGDGMPFNIMPPYKTVYMWRRTA